MPPNHNAGLETKHAPDEPPPFLGEWRRVYALIVAYLAALICLFYLFTRAFRP